MCDHVTSPTQTTFPHVATKDYVWWSGPFVKFCLHHDQAKSKGPHIDVSYIPIRATVLDVL